MEALDLLIRTLALLAIMLILSQLFFPEDPESDARFRHEEFARWQRQRLAEAKDRLRRPGI